MEKGIKVKARNKTLLGALLYALLSLIILVAIFFGIYGTTGVFYFDIMLCIFVPIVVLLVICAVTRLSFINRAQFVLGRVVRVENNSQEEGDVYQNIVIEFTDKENDQTIQKMVPRHFGDDDDDLRDKIDVFYREGQKLLGKEVPVLYDPDNPNKAMVFVDKQNMTYSFEIKKGH